MTKSNIASHHGPAWLLTLLIAGLSTLGPFSIDTYMPSFGAIAGDLHASPLQMQQTLSVYLLAFSVMMLFHGALSDSFGRRPVILTSLVVFIGASIGCALSYDIAHLLFFRGIQGLAAGGGMVVGRAMVRDMLEGHLAQKLMSRVTMIFGISPAVAPIIGGWLHAAFGWHSVFVFLALFGAAMWLLCLRFLPETLPHHGRQPISPGHLLQNYWKVGRNPQFLMLASTLSLHFAGFFLYISSAPVFVIQHLHLNESQFGWLFIPAVSGIILGAFISGRVAGKHSHGATVRAAYYLLFGGALWNMVYNFNPPPSLPWAVPPIALYSTGMSLAMANISLLALDLFPFNRGMVSSLQGFAQTMLNAIVAGVVSPMLSFSVTALAVGMVVFLVLGRLAWYRYEKLAAQKAFNA